MQYREKLIYTFLGVERCAEEATTETATMAADAG
jgi:hypothetical protein